MIEMLAQITGTIGGKPFTAGIVLWNDHVIEAAPILRKRLKGKTRDWVRNYCHHMNYTVEVVTVATRNKIT